MNGCRLSVLNTVKCACVNLHGGFCKCKQELLIISSVLDGLLELSWPAVCRTRSGSGLDSLCRGSSAVWSALLMFRDEFCTTSQ